MNNKIILSLFVIIFTLQMIESVQIGKECGPTSNVIWDEIRQLSYLMKKSLRPANCFKENLMETIWNIHEEHCGRCFIYMQKQFDEINKLAADNEEGIENCFREIIEEFNSFFALVATETAQCVKSSDNIQSLIAVEFTTLKKRKEVLDKAINKLNTICKEEYVNTWNENDYVKCLNHILVKATADAEGVMKYQENIPERFERSADDATNYFASCCDRVEPRWFELVQPVIETYQKCVEKLVQY